MVHVCERECERDREHPARYLIDKMLRKLARVVVRTAERPTAFGRRIIRFRVYRHAEYLIISTRAVYARRGHTLY